MGNMKTIIIIGIIIAFTILLMVSLIVVSQMETIQQGIWIITWEYADPILTPSLDYDYGTLYVMVLEIFGIIGGAILGINFVISRKRKLYLTLRGKSKKHSMRVLK